mgnify:FL=1
MDNIENEERNGETVKEKGRPPVQIRFSWGGGGLGGGGNTNSQYL